MNLDVQCLANFPDSLLHEGTFAFGVHLGSQVHSQGVPPSVVPRWSSGLDALPPLPRLRCATTVYDPPLQKVTTTLRISEAPRPTRRR